MVWGGREREREIGWSGRRNREGMGNKRESKRVSNILP